MSKVGLFYPHRLENKLETFCIETKKYTFLTCFIQNLQRATAADAVELL